MKSVKQCPKCGTETLIYKTWEDNKTFQLFRRRRCPGCGYRFNTEEIFIGETKTRGEKQV